MPDKHECCEDYWARRIRYKNFITKEDFEKRKLEAINYEFPDDKDVESPLIKSTISGVLEGFNIIWDSFIPSLFKSK